MQRASIRAMGMSYRVSLLSGFALAGFLALPAQAAEKQGMPDLAQVDQTCLPTSTANLIIWFANNGYPKLIASGATDDERYLHTVHLIMADTEARFDLGTQPDLITAGIKKYIKDCGYDCDVEFRPVTGATKDWFKENQDPNKGFVLILAYCNFNPENRTFTNALNVGHAVTLVKAEPTTYIIHDPAHEEGTSGHKIVTPVILTNGTFISREGSEPVAGLIILSSSLLDGPGDSNVLLTGAVCITMHPIKKPEPAAAKTPAASAPASESWVTWLFDLFFKK